MKNLEQELKMLLDERGYRIVAALGGQPRLQTNFYFGYPEMPRDQMVRVRQKGEEYILCYKKRLSQTEGVTVCDERECELSAEHARYVLERGLTADEMRKLCGVALPVTLLPLGKMDTYRTAFRWQEWDLELDKNVYLGFTDYELECEHRDAAMLTKLKDRLYYELGLRFVPSAPKIQRFLDRL